MEESDLGKISSFRQNFPAVSLVTAYLKVWQRMLEKYRIPVTHISLNKKAF